MKVTSAAHETAPRGGQASLGLFGIPDFDVPRQPLPRTPRPSRIKGALDSFSSDGLSAAHYHRPVAPVAKVQPALSAPAPVFAPAIVPPVASTASAMWAAARASDERERRRSTEDDEADFLSRCGGEDCVGITFASQD